MKFVVASRSLGRQSIAAQTFWETSTTTEWQGRKSRQKVTIRLRILMPSQMWHFFKVGRRPLLRSLDVLRVICMWYVVRDMCDVFCVAFDMCVVWFVTCAARAVYLFCRWDSGVCDMWKCAVWRMWHVWCVFSVACGALACVAHLSLACVPRGSVACGAWKCGVWRLWRGCRAGVWRVAHNIASRWYRFEMTTSVCASRYHTMFRAWHCMHPSCPTVYHTHKLYLLVQKTNSFYNIRPISSVL